MLTKAKTKMTKCKEMHDHTSKICLPQKKKHCTQTFKHFTSPNYTWSYVFK